MNRLTLDKQVTEMTMMELAQNCVYVKDGWVRYRNYEEDINLIELAVKLSRGLGGDIVTANQEKEDIDEELWDNLQYGYMDKDGLVAFIYANLVAMCNLRERLKAYEETKLTPDEAAKLLKKLGSFTLCEECKYCKTEEIDLVRWCRLSNGLDGDLEDGTGCSRGKKKVI